MTPEVAQLACLFGGFAALGLREPLAWTLAAAALWAAAVAAPPSARGLGDWRPWALCLAHAALCVLVSPEPARGLLPWARTATGLLVALCAAGWNLETRRRWLAALWVSGAVLAAAAFLWPSPHGVMVGFLPPYYNYTACLEAAVFASALGAADGGLAGPLGGLGRAAALAAGCEVARSGSRGALLCVAVAATAFVVRRCRPRPNGLRRRHFLAVALGRPRPNGLRRRHFLAVALGRPRPNGLRRRAAPQRPLEAAFPRRMARSHFLAVALGRPQVAAALIGVGLAGLAAFMPPGAFVRVLKLDKPASNQRPSLWRAAAAIADEHPLFGEGPGRFEAGFLRHNFPAPFRPTRYGLRSAHAHSEILQVAAERGWLGFILLAAAAGAALAAGLRRREAASETPLRRAAAWACAAAALQGLFDNVLALPALHWLFISAFALWVSPAGTVGSSKSGAQRAVCALGLAVCLLAWLPDWAAKRDLGLAVRLRPADADVQAALAREALRRRPPDAEGALARLIEAERLDPTNAVYPLLRAELARSRGDWKEVRDLAARAAALEPACPQARIDSIEAALRLGEAPPRDAAGRLERMAAPQRTSEAAPTAPDYDYDRLLLHVDEKRLRLVRDLLLRSARRAPCRSRARRAPR